MDVIKYLIIRISFAVLFAVPAVLALGQHLLRLGIGSEQEATFDGC